MRLLVLASAPHTNSVHERGVAVNLGPSFYRPQSCFSRDLAVLSAVVHRRQRAEQQQRRRRQWQQQNNDSGESEGEGMCFQSGSPQQLPPLHVADLMAGSGIRSMRYLQQAGADHVLCNEGDLANRPCLEDNLSSAVDMAAVAVGAGTGRAAKAHCTPTPRGGLQWLAKEPQLEREAAGVLPLCELTHEEAASLLARCRVEGRFFDLIDSDSFGAGSQFVGAALDAVRYGGLLCLTSTAGTMTGGRDPASAVALYHQHLAPVPFANEQGLRSLIGLAHREAMSRRLTVTPLWSLFSPHGPVFRTMLLVDRAQRQHVYHQRQHDNPDYGYVLHWPDSGESSCCPWHALPGALLAAGARLEQGGGNAAAPSGSPGAPPLLSGPLWLGPLHDRSHLQQLQREAAARGWLQAGAAAAGGSGADSSAGPVLPSTRKGSIGSLGLLMELLLEEAEAEAEGQAAAAAAGVAAAAAAGEVAAAGGTPQQGQQQQPPQQQQPQQLQLPPWFLRMNDLGRAGQLVGSPSRKSLAAELRRRGFLAARSHVDSSALRTTASMAEAVEAAVEGLGIRSRAASRHAATAVSDEVQ